MLGLRCPKCDFISLPEMRKCQKCGYPLLGVVPQEYPDKAVDEPKRVEALRMKAGQDAVGFAYATETEWICVCGTHNPLDKTECTFWACDRDRDFVLTHYTEQAVLGKTASTGEKKEYTDDTSQVSSQSATQQAVKEASQEPQSTQEEKKTSEKADSVKKSRTAGEKSALKFNCSNCGSDVIVKPLEVAETAECRICGAMVAVPENAAEIDEKTADTILAKIIEENKDIIAAVEAEKSGTAQLLQWGIVILIGSIIAIVIYHAAGKTIPHWLGIGVLFGLYLTIKSFIKYSIFNRTGWLKVKEPKG